VTDRRCGYRAIIDIAFAVGFGDVSHFNRMFRRFGDTPSGVRACAIAPEQNDGQPAHGLPVILRVIRDGPVGLIRLAGYIALHNLPTATASEVTHDACRILYGTGGGP
jgi:AraC-like DNA-binding protein